LVLFLKILVGVAALALGIYLGGTRYTQSPEEVSARMGKGRPRKAKRHFMWLNYLKVGERASERRRERRHFKTAVTRDRSQKRSED
jgi:hypothetical protein